MRTSPDPLLSRPSVPVVEADPATARRLRRRSLANLSCMGHCAPAVMQTLLQASELERPWLIRVSGGLPGGIGNSGNECGAVTAPLMLLGLKHARDPLDRGLPVVVYKGQDLLRRFADRHGTVLCKKIRGTERLPLRCANVVRLAPEAYTQTLARDCADAIPDDSRQAFARLYAHFIENRFHCGKAVLAQLSPAVPVDDEMLDAVSGFVAGTAFNGRTCGALTAGVMALGAAVGGTEHSRLRVLRMIGLMAVDGDAFANNRNAFNKTMNLGYRLSRWFGERFGSLQCRVVTRCDASADAGVDQYIACGRITECIEIASQVAAYVRGVVATSSR